MSLGSTLPSAGWKKMFPAESGCPLCTTLPVTETNFGAASPPHPTSTRKVRGRNATWRDIRVSVRECLSWWSWLGHDHPRARVAFSAVLVEVDDLPIGLADHQSHHGAGRGVADGPHAPVEEAELRAGGAR